MLGTGDDVGRRLGGQQRATPLPVVEGPEQLAGQQLRRLRLARDWTQEEVARRMRAAGYASWHQTTIAKIEGAQRPLRVRELVALAGVLPCRWRHVQRRVI